MASGEHPHGRDDPMRVVYDDSNGSADKVQTSNSLDKGKC